MNEELQREIGELRRTLNMALAKLDQPTRGPQPAGLDLAALLEWLATDLPAIILAIAKLIAVITSKPE